MCIMALPVRSVSNTRIFLGSDPDRIRQLTVYEMAVTLQTPGNAMILPVPAMSVAEIELLDLSAVPKFFDGLGKVFDRATTLGTRAMLSAPLKVHDVGNYRVSIAGSIADLSRVDPKVFSLSPETAATLARDYSFGFVFVVSTLRESGKFHPLAYTSLMSGRTMFVPTQHEHGSGHRRTQADWDHHIYRQRVSVFSTLPGSKDHTEVHGVRSDPHIHQMIQRWAAAMAEKAPSLAPFLDSGEHAKVIRTRFHGPLLNMDLQLEI